MSRSRRRSKHHAALKKAGHRIRALRTHRGISQETLGHLADLERAFVSGVERGEFNISVDALGRIADALDVHIGGFFNFR